jgi:hypothetical protein
MSDTIAVNNAALVAGLSPYVWYRDGSSFIRLVNPGGYFKVLFTGTSFGVEVDVSAMSSYNAAVYPVLKFSVDGGGTQSVQLTASDTVVVLDDGLSDTTHSILVTLKAVDDIAFPLGDSWTPLLSLKITGIVVDDGKTLSESSRGSVNMLTYGDSIMIGGSVIEAGPTSDATLSYVQLIADELGYEFGNASMYGVGLESNIGSYPAMTSAYALISDGISRSFDPVPNVVLINLGTNGSVTPSVLEGFLGDVRAAVGEGCYINLIVPFGQNNASEIEEGFNDYVAANPSDENISLINLGSTGATIVTENSVDGTHPNEEGNELLAEALLPLLLLPPQSSSPGYPSTSAMAAMM